MTCGVESLGAWSIRPGVPRTLLRGHGVPGQGSADHRLPAALWTQLLCSSGAKLVCWEGLQMPCAPRRWVQGEPGSVCTVQEVCALAGSSPCKMGCASVEGRG